MFLVSGGWSDWKIVSADQCQVTDFTGKIKRVRFCDRPTPRFGGDLCEEPDRNEDEISCSQVKDAGKVINILSYNS